MSFALMEPRKPSSTIIVLPFIKRKATSLIKKLNDIYFAFNVRQRASSTTSQTLSGSVTVEAAIALPLFLFFLSNLTTLFLAYHLYTAVDMELYKAAKLYATLGYAYEEHIDTSSLTSLVSETAMLLATRTQLNNLANQYTIVDGDIYVLGSQVYDEHKVTLLATYQIKPIIPIGSLTTILLQNKCIMRCYTGYEYSEDNDFSEQYVYVTPTGEVYHTTTTCSYLDIQTSSVTKNQVGERTPCLLCGDGESNIYYITQYGEKYHTTLECTSLSRTILAIPISEVGSRRCCSKCGG